MAQKFPPTPIYEMDQLDFQSTQRDLRNALTKKSLKYFEIALAMGADPLSPDDRNGGPCVYEIALSSYGYAEFVEHCLRNGCSPNYLNQYSSKAAINYAVDSIDPRIINALLRYPNVKVNRKACPLSPLNSLVINANNDNMKDVLDCLKSLLEYGAFISIPDQSQQTPLYHLEQNQQLDDVKKHEIRQHLFLYNLNNCPTHMIKGRPRVISVHRSNQPIEATFPNVTCGNLEKFEEEFLQRQLSDSDKVCILLEAIEEGEDEVLDFLLQHQVDYNGSFDDMSPLLFACAYGNSYALKRLLDHGDLNLGAVESPLAIVVLNMGEERHRVHSEHMKCFYLLLKCNRLDINETDTMGNTALHYAVKYRRGEVIRELLKMRAYIGGKNRDDTMPLEHMSPKQLEECLDDSITSNDSPLGDDSFEIQINYQNIIAPSNDSTTRHLHEEMAPLAFMAESKEHQYLLQHPLISSFLWLKWRQLSFVFYVNLAMYVCFAASLIAYTILKFSGRGTVVVLTILWFSCWLGIAYMITREFLQCVIAPQHYLSSPANYMEVIIIILAIITCNVNGLDPESQKTISVCTMLLVALELFLLFGSLPVLSMSTHMLMLEVVCLTFLKSFMLYSIFVVTFGLCFYILFNKPKVMAEGNAGSFMDDEGGDFNKFTSPLRSVIKTIVMVTGELDAGDIKLDTLCSYMLFLLFVFLMTIVLYNLLNGLAVSDIQAIKGQAELNGAICRTKLLARYEGILTGNSQHMHSLLNCKWLRPICHRVLHLYPNYRHITIRPNESKRINSTPNTTVPTSISSISLPKDNEAFSHHHSYYPKMNKTTIKLATDIVEQKRKSLRRQTRIRDIETQLNNINNKMSEVLKNVRKP